MNGSDPQVGCCALGCALSLRTLALAKASDGPAQPGPRAGECDVGVGNIRDCRHASGKLFRCRVPNSTTLLSASSPRQQSGGAVHLPTYPASDRVPRWGPHVPNLQGPHWCNSNGLYLNCHG